MKYIACINVPFEIKSIHFWSLDNETRLAFVEYRYNLGIKVVYFQFMNF